MKRIIILLLAVSLMCSAQIIPPRDTYHVEVTIAHDGAYVIHTLPKPYPYHDAMSVAYDIRTTGVAVSLKNGNIVHLPVHKVEKIVLVPVE